MFQPVLTLILALFIASASYATERVALVIGNSDYQHATVKDLPNAAQDARDVSQRLSSLGFRVHSGIDLTRSEILRLTQDVQKSLNAGDIALFYFAGHAIQLGAENFLIPVDAYGNDEETLRQRSVKLQTILAEMESRADRNIVILDACRDNPFDLTTSKRSVGGATRGLVKIDAGVGSFVAFSTQPGNVALDGLGRNSPFTAALLKHLPSTEDDLHEVMRKVRRDVVEQTNGAQIPWENSSLIDRIYLAPRITPVPNTPPPPPPTPVQPVATGQFTHQVAGLDPYGDGFLALRNGTTSSASRLMKMVEGTRLQVLEQNGVWFRVRTETGAQGWAHSNWIRFVGVRSAQPQETCNSLWLQRNAIFARNGYCFQSARGQQAFSNLGCRIGVPAGQIPLSASERQEVQHLRSRETALQCR
ncbi:YARHG domain-containing protein [Parasedimentitalea maritima]|uniref:YARHG domain-containing protein n=1 Tax=Parasedimentitalea maritima TaxID=2578117 RepID=A0ABY2V421_9RHOB|nr:caspase family protein [Zongyanglinia marina]TLP69043.1 YARHG domain-containing protein [Zongyanglinia marina]